MKILVCGDRDWIDAELIAEVLLLVEDFEVLVHGANGYLPSGAACYTNKDLMNAVKGADALAHQVAVALKVPIEAFWPDWKTYGLGAGPKRNTSMLNYGVDLVFAFHDNLARSKGTKDMVTKAEKAGVEVIRITH